MTAPPHPHSRGGGAGPVQSIHQAPLAVTALSETPHTPATWILIRYRMKNNQSATTVAPPMAPSIVFLTSARAVTLRL